LLFLGKHRPSVDWPPYKKIITDGVYVKDFVPPTLEAVLGQYHPVIASHYIGPSTFHATRDVSVPVFGTVPNSVLQQMLGQIKFRKHPKNPRKSSYTLTTVGQKGAVGKAADSNEEVCQLIWEEYGNEWPNRVSIKKT